MRQIIVTTEKPVAITKVEQEWNPSTREWKDVEVVKESTEFEFYSTAEAKKFCNQHLDANPIGEIYSVKSNGDFECLGELKFKGSNAHTLSTRTTENYN